MRVRLPLGLGLWLLLLVHIGGLLECTGQACPPSQYVCRRPCPVKSRKLMYPTGWQLCPFSTSYNLPSVSRGPRAERLKREEAQKKKEDEEERLEEERRRKQEEWAEKAAQSKKDAEERRKKQEDEEARKLEVRNIFWTHCTANQNPEWWLLRMARSLGEWCN